jgi:aspartyl-tRNA synthetase
MIGGFDRYFQVAKCFRDEDLRPNRQPEFTQLDLEASFIDESFIYELIEEIIVKIFATEQIKITAPFTHLPYDEAMNKYGSDAPDLRFGLELVDVTDVFVNTTYKIFRNVLDGKGVIKGFNIKGQAEVLTKNILQNDYAMEVIPRLGGKGMTWMKVIDGTLQSNIVQFFSAEEQANLIKTMQAENGDVLIFIADKPLAKVNEILGRFRLFVAEKLNLIDEKVFNVCWVTDFPLFEKKQGKVDAVHHPFTQANQNILEIKSEEELLQLKARAYDLVINGVEIGGGSIRNHDIKVQERVFEILGFNKEEIEEKFGFFLNAFKYGAPPHGGLALGVDRLISMILNTSSIREVIAFPKNRMAVCPLSKAPAVVEEKQIAELHLKYHKNIN